MRIVGITGKKRSGKDTAAAALTACKGFVRVAFADALKRMAIAVNPILFEDALGRGRLSDVIDGIGWERAKDRYPEVRRILDHLGTEGVRGIIGEDSWTRAWDRTVSELRHHEGVVVPDVRFLNEADHLRDGLRLGDPRAWRRLGDRALIIRVVRPGLADDGDRHASETEMDRIVPDLTIVNDGNRGDLQRKVLAAYDTWTEAAA